MGEHPPLCAARTAARGAICAFFIQGSGFPHTPHVSAARAGAANILLDGRLTWMDGYILTCMYVRMYVCVDLDLDVDVYTSPHGGPQQLFGKSCDHVPSMLGTQGVPSERWVGLSAPAILDHLNVSPTWTECSKTNCKGPMCHLEHTFGFGMP